MEALIYLGVARIDLNNIATLARENGLTSLSCTDEDGEPSIDIAFGSGHWWCYELRDLSDWDSDEQEAILRYKEIHQCVCMIVINYRMSQLLELEQFLTHIMNVHGGVVYSDGCLYNLKNIGQIGAAVYDWTVWQWYSKT